MRNIFSVPFTRSNLFWPSKECTIPTYLEKELSHHRLRDALIGTQLLFQVWNTSTCIRLTFLWRPFGVCQLIGTGSRYTSFLVSVATRLLQPGRSNGVAGAIAACSNDVGLTLRRIHRSCSVRKSSVTDFLLSNCGYRFMNMLTFSLRNLIWIIWSNFAFWWCVDRWPSQILSKRLWFWNVYVKELAADKRLLCDNIISICFPFLLKIFDNVHARTSLVGRVAAMSLTTGTVSAFSCQLLYLHVAELKVWQGSNLMDLNFGVLSDCIGLIRCSRLQWCFHIEDGQSATHCEWLRLVSVDAWQSVSRDSRLAPPHPRQ